MKQIFTLLLAMCMGGMVDAQLFNSSMEDWHITYKGLKMDAVAPDGWHCHDSLLGRQIEYGHAFFGSRWVTPDSDAHTGYIAAKLISKNTLPYSYPAVLTNGKVEPDPQTTTSLIPGLKFTGGMAVSERIDSVTAWIKYAPVSPDTAMFYAEALVKGIGANGGDSIVGGGIIRIDHSISTYEEVGFKLLYRTKKIKPDLLRIVFASSPINSANAKIGSTLLVDDIRYVVDTTTDTTGDTTVYTHIVPVKGIKSVTCYPNPAAKTLQVTCGIDQPCQFYLYSMEGRLVLEQAILNNGYIDIAHISTGQYIWTVTDEQKHTLARDRLVITR